MKSILSGLLALLLAFVLITVVALELSGVVTVETRSTQNALRSTHVWFIRTEDALYLEAGHPDNPWVQDLKRIKFITLSGAGLDGQYRYEQYRDDASHQKIRRLMAAKYGWRDWWVSVLFDTTQSSMLSLTKIRSTP